MFIYTHGVDVVEAQLYTQKVDIVEVVRQPITLGDPSNTSNSRNRH